MIVERLSCYDCKRGKTQPTITQIIKYRDLGGSLKDLATSTKERYQLSYYSDHGDYINSLGITCLIIHIIEIIPAHSHTCLPLRAYINNEHN
jgi:hypothetical protein